MLKKCCWCFGRCCAAWVVFIALFIAWFLNFQKTEIPRPGSYSEKYIPGLTTVADYPIVFAPAGVQSLELNLGLDFMVSRGLPDWVMNLWRRVAAHKGWKMWEDVARERPQVNFSVTFHDARQAVIDHKKTGFTLVTMPTKSKTQMWRGFEDIKHFHTEMEPEIKKLYPEVKRIDWTYNVVRGGFKLGDQPAFVDGPHLDFHQNETARTLFHSEFPANRLDNQTTMLWGENDAEDEQLKVVLGIWKPVYMNTPVCDNPVAVMDASTFRPQQDVPLHMHWNVGAFAYHNLNGAIGHNPDQKWYYYSFQTTEEVLVFTHYSRGKFLANPHTSFRNPNCPAGFEGRISVEMRAGLFFGRDYVVE